MFRKALSFILMGLILNLTFYSTARANTDPEKEAGFAAKVKAAVTKPGTSSNARIAVKLRDKTKIKGYVSQVREDSFVVVDDKTGASTEIPYPQVKGAKGNNLSIGSEIAISIGILLVIALYRHLTLE